MKRIKLFIFALFASVVAFTQEHNIYVSAIDGNDSNSGNTITNAFQTLATAKNKAKSIFKSNPSAKVNIYLREGIYYSSSNYTFNANDLGNGQSELMIAAYNEEKPILMGNRVIPRDKWKTLSSAAKERCHPDVDSGKLYELDLTTIGMNNITSLPDMFTTVWNSVDLFVGNDRMQLSQYPNVSQKVTEKSQLGWITCNGSKDASTFYYAEGGAPADKDFTNELEYNDKTRAGRWKKSMENGHELWLKGNWRVPWDPITIKVKEINTTEKYIRFVKMPPLGMGSKYTGEVPGSNPVYRYGSGEETYFAINYLDEIDEPGEWAIDFKDKKIYFYPKAEKDLSNVILSDNKTSLVKLDGVSNITFSGIEFNGNLGYGIEIVNGSKNITLEGCKIHNISSTGIHIEKSSEVRIQSNDIFNIGSFAIYAKQCGNLYTLTDANIIIDNNHIYNMGLLAFNGGIGLLECAGFTISHNLIHDTPKSCIENRNGIKILIEYNEMHNIALKSGDTGAVYSYGGWYTYGNVLRYNFIHHICRGNGLYPDDGDSGDVMYNNIIHGGVNGFHVGGGHDNLMYNNMVVNCQKINIDNRGIARNYKLGTNYEKDLTRFNVNAASWSKWGEDLMREYKYQTNLWTEILTEEYGPENPRNCSFNDNVLIEVGEMKISDIKKDN